MFSRAREKAPQYVTPAWKQPPSSGSAEYESSSDSVEIHEPHHSDPPDSSPKDKRMVLVLPAWRGFQQMVRKHRVIDQPYLGTWK